MSLRRYESVNYRIEIERTSPSRREGIQSTGDIRQLANDLFALLKRLYGPDLAKRIIAEQVLPIFEEEHSRVLDLPQLPDDGVKKDDRKKDKTEDSYVPQPSRIV